MVITAGVDPQSPKARQILEGVRSAFLDLGYEGASTDEIVRRAGVSKGTLYNYFPEKKSLFTAFVEEECRKQANLLFKAEGQPEDIEAFLREAARELVKLLLSSFMQGIYRLAVAEAQRFPELARTFYDSGPDLATRRLAQVLSGAVARGHLQIDDVDLAAHQFDQLCKADIFYKRLFKIRSSFAEEEIDRVADAAVDVFLRAYRVPGSAPSI
ncbi:MAG: TetR/AcrR family transcriptional regulator C-terminal domain-containing protein [Inquilinaceae bacterium]